MATVNNPALARERIDAQLSSIGRLRGSGPNPFDYTIWDARTLEVLSAVFGEGSAALVRYQNATGVSGRLPGVRGEADNMTLNIHGQWGILGRLGRAEAVLRDLAASLD